MFLGGTRSVKKLHRDNGIIVTGNKSPIPAAQVVGGNQVTFPTGVVSHAVFAIEASPDFVAQRIIGIHLKRNFPVVATHIGHDQVGIGTPGNYLAVRKLDIVLPVQSPTNLHKMGLFEGIRHGCGVYPEGDVDLGGQWLKGHHHHQDQRHYQGLCVTVH